MNLKEKLELFKQKGFTYNSETGQIKSHRGYIIKGKTNGYIICNLKYNKKMYSIHAHTLSWYLYYNEVPNLIDHINRIKTDNRIENLRNVNQTINCINRSNVKGYHLHKPTNKYRARIVINKKQITIGYFETQQDAHEAYIEAKKIYHII